MKGRFKPVAAGVLLLALPWACANGIDITVAGTPSNPVFELRRAGKSGLCVNNLYVYEVASSAPARVVLDAYAWGGKCKSVSRFGMADTYPGLKITRKGDLEAGKTYELVAKGNGLYAAKFFTVKDGSLQAADGPR